MVENMIAIDSLPSKDIAALRRLIDLTQRLNDCLSRPSVRAWEAGNALREIRDGKLFVEDDCKDFKSYLQKNDLPKATSYRNLQLVELFKEEDMAIGVSKLSAIGDTFGEASRSFLTAAIRDGLTLDGESAPVNFASISYRSLLAYLKTVRPVKGHSRGLDELLRAAAPLLQSESTDAGLSNPVPAVAA